MVCDIYIYISLNLTVPTEAHKLLQDGIKVSHGKAMMWSEKVTTALQDHRQIFWITSEKNVVQI